MPRPELLAIGGAYVDINCLNFPFDDAGLRPETESVGDNYICEAGGSASNFARLCSALEVPATFVGKVGDDAMGDLFAKLLTESGVTPALITEPEVQTNISMNLVNADGKTIMSVAGNANQSLNATEVRQKVEPLLGSSSYLLIGGCFKLNSLLPAFTELQSLAKNSGVKTVLDHGRLNSGVTAEQMETVKRLAKDVEYYLPSAGELQELWNVTSIEAGLRLLAQTVHGIVVVKDGPNGAATLIDGQLVRVPAFDVQPIHTVGAGDSFNAGFIAAQGKGLDLRSSMRFACATAGLKISQVGLPSYQDIEKYLK